MSLDIFISYNEYDKAIEIDPDHVRTWNNKGTILETLVRFNEISALPSFPKKDGICI